MMFRFAVLLCISFLLEHGAQAASCSPGWVAQGARCYYFSRDTVNYVEALSFCAHYDAVLVEMLNNEESNFVAATFKDKQILQFWIGITDMFEEGKWVRSTSLQKVENANWGYGEPNNYDNSQHCAVVKGLSVDDIQCASEHNFVCSKG